MFVALSDTKKESGCPRVEYLNVITEGSRVRTPVKKPHGH